MTEDILLVNGRRYLIYRMLGKGKGGYSYLAERLGLPEDEIVFKNFDAQKEEYIDDNKLTVSLLTDSFPSGYMFAGLSSVPSHYVLLKMIHHEPCDYYTFGNKIASEMRDYKTLWSIGIPMPKMYSVDEDQEIIVKEFIDGPTILMMLMNNDFTLPDDALRQVREMAETAKAAGLNIDYFPTNFIYSHGKLYYIDYECNAYMEEWSFDNWGIKYWTKTPELVDYIENHVKK